MIELFEPGDLTPSELALRKAAEAFQAATTDLAGLLAAVAFQQAQRERFDAVASDVVNSAAVLIEDHRRARFGHEADAKRKRDDPVARLLRDPCYLDDEDALRKEIEIAIGPPAAYLARMKSEMSATARLARRLSVAYKGFFVFVRAYQDAIYCVLNGTTDGTMSRAARNRLNPVRQVLSVQAPDYLAWFEPFKNRRDEIKVGKVVSMTNMGGRRAGDLGLMFGIDAGQPIVFHLTEATEALEMSEIVTRVAQARRE